MNAVDNEPRISIQVQDRESVVVFSSDKTAQLFGQIAESMATMEITIESLTSEVRELRNKCDQTARDAKCGSDEAKSIASEAMATAKSVEGQGAGTQGQRETIESFCTTALSELFSAKIDAVEDVIRRAKADCHELSETIESASVSDPAALEHGARQKLLEDWTVRGLNVNTACFVVQHDIASLQYELEKSGSVDETVSSRKAGAAEGLAELETMREKLWQAIGAARTRAEDLDRKEQEQEQRTWRHGIESLAANAAPQSDEAIGQLRRDHNDLAASIQRISGSNGNHHNPESMVEVMRIQQEALVRRLEAGVRQEFTNSDERLRELKESTREELQALENRVRQFCVESTTVKADQETFEATSQSLIALQLLMESLQDEVETFKFSGVNIQEKFTKALEDRIAKFTQSLNTLEGGATKTCLSCNRSTVQTPEAPAPESQSPSKAIPSSNKYAVAGMGGFRVIRKQNPALNQTQMRSSASEGRLPVNITMPPTTNVTMDTPLGGGRPSGLPTTTTLTGSKVTVSGREIFQEVIPVTVQDEKAAAEHNFRIPVASTVSPMGLDGIRPISASGKQRQRTEPRAQSTQANNQRRRPQSAPRTRTQASRRG